MNKIKKRYQGMNSFRYKENPLEHRFAKEWQKLEAQGRGMLAYLLDDTNRGNGPVSPRDELVAATVIQWLGSPVGQGFLSSVLESFEADGFHSKYGGRY